MFRRLFRSFTVQSDHILLEEHRNLFRIGAQAQDEVHVVLRAQFRQHLHDRFRFAQRCRARVFRRIFAFSFRTDAGAAAEEATTALQMLGFAKPNINKAIQAILKENPSASVEEIIKAALQRL